MDPDRHALLHRNTERSNVLIVALALFQVLGSVLIATDADAAPATDALADIGRILFFDANLSKNRTQSCATCHDPERAFIDGRDNGVGGAASLGDDGHSIGDRNAPSAAYAALTPPFQKNDEGHYIGGQFVDGRATTLAIQAIEPLTNPLEMALPDTAAVIERVQENSILKGMLVAQFGANLFTDAERALAAIGECISAFEQTATFAPFDSKYDRYLRGEYKLTALEELGRSLFFSDLTNCSSCHLLNTSTLKQGETFTNYRYHNIGLPPNMVLRGKNGRSPEHKDKGLSEHPAIDDPSLAGKFRVPTLRNVAVTGPYMHNGIFSDLRTAILFYNKYTVSSAQSRINPETNLAWGEPEIKETIDIELLNQGQPIDDGRARALIAFLYTLTDARYESLINR